VHAAVVSQASFDCRYVPCSGPFFVSLNDTPCACCGGVRPTEEKTAASTPRGRLLEDYYSTTYVRTDVRAYVHVCRTRAPLFKGVRTSKTLARGRYDVLLWRATSWLHAEADVDDRSTPARHGTRCVSGGRLVTVIQQRTPARAIRAQIHPRCSSRHSLSLSPSATSTFLRRAATNADRPQRALVSDRHATNAEINRPTNAHPAFAKINTPQ
jgi:hypothetical protein